MAEKVKTVGVKATRIRNTGPTQPRLDPATVAAALGAKPLCAASRNDQGPITLAALGMPCCNGSALPEAARSSPKPPDAPLCP